MTICYIGLGSNLETPTLQISKALSAIASLDSVNLVETSSYYRSTPYGGIQQPDYINAVAEVETELDAGELLNCLFEIESAQGRKRGKEKWGPRTIDLDLLMYGQEIIQCRDITVPHPEIPNRNFVLYPLFEIKNKLEIPGMGLLENLLKKSTTDGLKKLA